MSRKKKPTPKAPKTPSLDEVRVADPAALLVGGRSEFEAPVVASESEPNVGGRPPLVEEVKRRDVALRLTDAQQLELLGPQWMIASSAEVSIKVTPIVRSVMALMMPVLKDLEEIPTDEFDLRRILARALTEGIDPELLQPVLDELP